VRDFTQLTLFELPEPEPVVIARELAGNAELRGILATDPRLGSLVRALNPRAKTLGQALAHLSTRKLSSRAHKALREMQKGVADAQAFTLEQELLSLVQATNIKRVKPILEYLGWDGRGGSTLQEAGDHAGITRERVRQVADKVFQRIGRKTFAPALDRVLASISDPVMEADDVERKWTKRNLTATNFRVEGVLQAAELLRGDCRFRVRELEGRRLLVSESGDRAITVARKVALKTCKRFTVMSLRDLAARVASENTRGGAFDLALAIESLPGFAWLDKSSGWFWIKDREGRLAKRIRKILSVAPRISLNELRSGIARDHRMAGFAPPKQRLAELCRLFGFQVHDGQVVTDLSLDWTKVLGATERTMVRVLRQAGGVLSRESFERKCLENGMNRHTFFQYLSYSPVISRYAAGIYGVPGAKVEPGLTEELRPRRSNRQVLRDWGYLPDRRVWVGYRLSSSAMTLGILSLPTGMTRLINGDFIIRTAAHEEMGMLRCKGSRAWGLKSLIERRGLEPNDFLMLTFNLRLREVLTAYGPEELWDNPVEEERHTGSTLEKSSSAVLRVSVS